MTDPCPLLDDLLALAERPAQDARWNHVRACPRCRSRLAAYRAFSTTEEGEAPGGEDEAVPRLRAFLESRILGKPASTDFGARPSSGAGPGIGGLLKSAFNPRFLIPAGGAAAIVVAIFLIVRSELPGPSGPPIMREEPAGYATEAVITSPPRISSDGGIELRWRRTASAETYRIRLLDAGMQELRRIEVRSDTLLVLTASHLAGLKEPVFWQVEALREGDRIGDSAPSQLPAEGR